MLPTNVALVPFRKLFPDAEAEANQHLYSGMWKRRPVSWCLIWKGKQSSFPRLKVPRWKESASFLKQEAVQRLWVHPSSPWSKFGEHDPCGEWRWVTLVVISRLWLGQFSQGGFTQLWTNRIFVFQRSALVGHFTSSQCETHLFQTNLQRLRFVLVSCGFYSASRISRKDNMALANLDSEWREPWKRPEVNAVALPGSCRIQRNQHSQMPLFSQTQNRNHGLVLILALCRSAPKKEKHSRTHAKHKSSQDFVQGPQFVRPAPQSQLQ